MLDVLRRNKTSAIVYLFFGIIIVVFVFTFNTAGPSTGIGGAKSANEALAKVAGGAIDTGDLSLGMLLSVDAPTPSKKDFEVVQARERYKRTRLPFAAPDPEVFALSPFDGPVPELKLDKVMAELVESHLVASEADKRGLGATDEELRDRVLLLPRIFGHSGLGDEKGKFSRERYDSFVSYTLRTSKARLESFIKREILRDKMAQAVTAGVTVSDAEAKALVDADKGRAELEYASFDPESMAEAVQVNDAEVNVWLLSNQEKARKAYEERKDKFNQPAKAVVRGILFAASSTDPDEKKAAAKKAADAELAELKKAWDGTTPLPPAPGAVVPEGQPAPEPQPATALNPAEKLSRLAALFSEHAKSKTEHHNTKDVGGQFVDPKTQEDLAGTPFSKAIAEAVFKADAGALLGPLESQQGYWLVFVEQRIAAEQKTYEQVATQLGKEILKKERAETDLDKLAADFLAQAKAAPTKPLAEVAKAWNLAHGGQGDGAEGPVKPRDTGAIGQSPIEALQPGIAELLGMPSPAIAFDEIPGIGKVPALVRDLPKLKTDAPVAPAVYSTEGSKARYVARLKEKKPDAPAKDPLDEAAKDTSPKDAPEVDKTKADKESADKQLANAKRALTAIKKAEVYRAWYKALRDKAEKDGVVTFTESYKILQQEEIDRRRDQEKKVAAGGAATPAPSPFEE